VVRNALIAVYIVVVLAFSVAARATILPAIGTDFDENITENLQAYNYKSHVGQLAVQGNEFVLITQNEILPLKSEMDMSAFIGSQVMISGIELEHQLAPKMKVEVVDPLPGFTFGNEIVFFVFGITQVTQ
jgi:hypothetical protein